MKSKVNHDYIESLVKKFLPQSFDKVSQAIEYSVFGGGKRFRPMLLLQSAESVGGKINDNAERLACALEFIHTYSLIHDDLPAMDNDEIRRGKRSCHMQFGEAAAILAGDGLLNLAMEVVLAGDLSSENYREACKFMFYMSGTRGMVYGQSLDLFTETVTLDDAKSVALHKTGDLIRCALVCGAYCGGAKKDEIPVFDQIGTKLGICYQVIDDILDAEKCEKSFLDVMSEQGCVEYAHKLADEVSALCKKLPYDLSFIEQFAQTNLSRKK